MDPSVRVKVANVDYEKGHIQMRGKESGPECTCAIHLPLFKLHD
jgi:hypothetical protein